MVKSSCTALFFFSSRRRHTRFDCDWSSDVCSSDLVAHPQRFGGRGALEHLRIEQAPVLAQLIGICEAVAHLRVELSLRERVEQRGVGIDDDGEFHVVPLRGVWYPVISPVARRAPSRLALPIEAEKAPPWKSQ